MQEYKTKIEEIWSNKDKLSKGSPEFKQASEIISYIINHLEVGKLAVVEQHNDRWLVNEWVKKAILLNFIVSDMKIYDGNCTKWYDKIDPLHYQADNDYFLKAGYRVVPGAFIRKGVHIGKKSVIMPSFVNIGAHIGEGTLVDTWATIGSCAHIGKNCHISGGVGIGGVLEPLQAQPVIIEDNCFIGARSEIVEGVIVEKGSVISMGVFVGSSTKIVDRNTGAISYGRIPAYSVVVPGALPAHDPKLPSLYCAVIIKKVDENTRAKTAINELLRD